MSPYSDFIDYLNPKTPLIEALEVVLDLARENALDANQAQESDELADEFKRQDQALGRVSDHLARLYNAHSNNRR